MADSRISLSLNVAPVMTVTTSLVSEHQLNMLREEYDERGYSVEHGSPGWLHGLNDFSIGDLGALALTGPSGISSGLDDNHPKIIFDPPSIYLAGLAGRIRHNNLRLSVGLPPLARDISCFALYQMSCASQLREPLIIQWVMGVS